MWKQIAISVVATFLALLGAEHALRIVSKRSMVVVFDVEHGQPVYKAGLVRQEPVLGVTATFDSRGYRNGADTTADAPYKVLVAGDSSIAALFVDDKDTPHAALQRALRERGLAANVDNIGVAGYGPDQSLFRIEHATRAASYQIVAFHVFGDNDLGDLVRNNFPIVDARLVNDGFCGMSVFERISTRLELVHAITGIGGRLLKHLPFLAKDYATNCSNYPDEAGGEWPSPENAMVDGAEREIGYFFAKDQLDEKSYRAHQKRSFGNDHYDVSIAMAASGFLEAEALKRLAIVFETLKALGASRGFRPLVVVVPAKFDTSHLSAVNPSTLRAYSTKRSLAYDQARLTSLIERASLAAGLDTLNLFGAFRSAERPLFFSEVEYPGDAHWNRQGIAMAMRELAEWIVGYGNFAVASPAKP